MECTVQDEGERKSVIILPEAAQYCTKGRALHYIAGHRHAGRRGIHLGVVLVVVTEYGIIEVTLAACHAQSHHDNANNMESGMGPSSRPSSSRHSFVTVCDGNFRVYLRHGQTPVALSRGEQG